jgi:large subunit ribosomal protein L29
MKTVELSKLRQLTLNELQAKAVEYKDDLFTSRFSLKTGQLADSSKLRKARRAFAQVQTLITERRNDAASGGAL